MSFESSYFLPINDYVNHCGSFNPDELKRFNELLRLRHVKKKQILLREGEICDFEAYIVKGCLRSFYVDENGSEVILQFSIEDWWVGDMASFNDRTPSSLYIEALEDTTILTLNPERKEQLLQEIPAFERVFRLMLQRHIAALEQRLIRTIAKPAADKYQEFVKRYPSIVQRVPQHYIAAYLGMTPEFLSKVRRKLATQK
jgi:CRP/FNR family cyclic AMP-dependent transcriptional regulator